MKKQTNKNTENTADWFRSVMDACPHGDFSRFRAEIIFRCGWNSRSTYSNKYHGRSDMLLQEHAVVKQLAEKYGVPVPEVEPVAVGA